MFSCSYVFPKQTCSLVLMSSKTMFSCLTAACVVRFGDRTSYIYFYFLQIIRHNNPALEELSRLQGVIMFARVYSLLLGVIEDKVLDVELSGKFARVESRAVAFLVRLKGVALSV